MMNIVRLCCVLGICTAAIGAFADGYNLVKDGKVTSCIILPDNAGPVERHAADELASYLEKVTGARVAIGGAPSKELYNIYLGTTAAKNVPRSDTIDKAIAQLKDDGFVLCADKDGIRVIGKKPVSVLYGAYEILKKYADIRWFAPGADFEYCPRKPTVAVPGQVTVRNPAFRFRQLIFYCCHTNSKTVDSWDWFVRNGFNLMVHKGLVKAYPAEMEKRGAEILQHCSFNDLLGNDRLFDTHPEYYGLFDGKRMKMNGEKRQPCTSHPQVAEIMAACIDKRMDEPPRGGGYLIGNNDSTAWCQCENCIKLDPPEEKQKHFVSTRNFTFINTIAGEIYKTHPDADLWSWAYQNFLEPPTRVVPDPRLSLELCLVGRCYRHSIADEKCRVNAKFRNILAGWLKLHPLKLLPYEYSWCESPANVPVYTPKERVYCRDLKYYHKIGMEGFKQTIAPPDGTFSPPWNTRHQTEAWYGEWQLLYLAGRLAWDIDADYDQLVEDMGSKYYGKAWPAMKPYREELIKMYEENADHLLGWGGTPHYILGKCLEKPGVEVRLLQLLSEAEKLAADDPVAMKRIKRDVEYFGIWWQSVHKDFLARKLVRWEVNVNKRVDPIVIDGEFGEDDWKRIDNVADFIATDGKTAADPRTFVKMLYDEDNIYFAVEAMESDPGKMKIKARKHDDEVARDNNLELWIAGFMSDKSVKIALNPKGVIQDAVVVSGKAGIDPQYDSGVEVKTKVLADRWVAEIRVPAAACGRKIKDWDVWKVNVVRNRRLGRFWNLLERESQTSSWSKGALAGPESLRSVVLGDAVIRGNGLVETALLKNGDFEDVAAPVQKESGVSSGAKVPEFWSNDTGTVTMVEGGAASGRQFLRIKTSRKPWAQLFQGINPPADFKNNLRLRAKVRGKGNLSCGGWLKGGCKIDSREWMDMDGVYIFEAGKKINGLAFQVTAGEIDLDDVTVTQIDSSRSQ